MVGLYLDKCLMRVSFAFHQSDRRGANICRRWFVPAGIVRHHLKVYMVCLWALRSLQLVL
jgi:hypothetical protein